MARRGSLTGVDERGMSTRIPQEPGRSHDLRVKGRMGPGESKSGPAGVASVPAGANKRRRPGTDKRRKRSASRWVVGSRNSSYYR